MHVAHLAGPLVFCLPVSVGAMFQSQCVLGRWSSEASAALEELQKAKKALQEILGNVK